MILQTEKLPKIGSWWSYATHGNHQYDPQVIFKIEAHRSYNNEPGYRISIHQLMMRETTHLPLSFTELSHNGYGINSFDFEAEAKAGRIKPLPSFDNPWA